VKRLIAGLALVLIVVPFLVSCEIRPEDKWPNITTYAVTANFDVKLEILKAIGAPRLTIPDREVDLSIDIVTYNANQKFTVKIFLYDVIQQVTYYEANLPTDTVYFALPITETHRIDQVTGSYLGGGHPPQGKTQLNLFYTPGFFPTELADWINYDVIGGMIQINWITDRYIYYYRVIVEDAEGRSDTFAYSVISELIIEED
jgi:hypothetical protein